MMPYTNHFSHILVWFLLNFCLRLVLLMPAINDECSLFLKLILPLHYSNKEIVKLYVFKIEMSSCSCWTLTFGFSCGISSWLEWSLRISALTAFFTGFWILQDARQFYWHSNNKKNLHVNSFFYNNKYCWCKFEYKLHAKRKRCNAFHCYKYLYIIFIHYCNKNN
ncbi:unnamed protein product [Blepharisma stoltei]|uniref:Uncharacterized protein n=1 Tax=Blepharisma stoltei TaxID=1481888 RepID=A0AAU9KE16_9CILI|nr:unnamed protein product [Blepharisma stoltei]